MNDTCARDVFDIFVLLLILDHRLVDMAFFPMWHYAYS